MELYKNYRLERLLNQSGDLLNFCKAMQWVHENLLHHEIEDDYQGRLIATDIIAYAKTMRTSVNCIAHAVTLSQVLLAMGYKARYVECLFIDGLEYDFHVVTEAFSLELNHWVLLDSTINSYFSDDNNNILSLIEFRNRIINCLPVQFHYCDRFANSGAKRSLITQKYSEAAFIESLKKNLFVLQYPKNNDVKSYIGKQETYFYRLVPTNYYCTNTEKRVLDYRFGSVCYRYTDNPSFIYERPLYDKNITD